MFLHITYITVQNIESCNMSYLLHIYEGYEMKFDVVCLDGRVYLFGTIATPINKKAKVWI